MRIPYEGTNSLGSEYVDIGHEVVAVILRTLVAGWRRARGHPDITAQTGELLMTERLRDGMRNELTSSDCPWRKTLIVLPGAESRSTQEASIPDGRTDIPLMLIEVFLRTQVHDPHAVIECKRIDGSNTHLCREYVKEGIDRFVSGKYAFNHEFGFMVGYVLTGSAPDSAAGVNAHLERTSRTNDRLELDNLLSDICTWRSRHDRPATVRPIILRHSFFQVPDCSIQ